MRERGHRKKPAEPAEIANESLRLNLLFQTLVDLVDAILAGAPGTVVCATSREPLWLIHAGRAMTTDEAVAFALEEIEVW